MAKIPPMPMEPWHNARSTKFIPAMVVGGIFNAISQWWLAGCPDIKMVPEHIRLMGKLRQADWLRYETEVMAAMHELMPPLKESFDRRQAKIAKLQFNIKKAAQVALDNKRQRKRANKLADEVDNTRLPVVPQKSAPAQALARERAIIKPKVDRGVALSDTTRSNPFLGADTDVNK